MASETTGPNDAFDIRAIRQMVKLMNENDLAELDLRKGTQRIRLRKRGSEVVPVVTAAPTAVLATPPSVASHVLAGAPVPTASPPEAVANFTEIKSPMLGTFYTAPSPDTEPFVQVGSHVDKDTVVCIIEAMKVFNEITADCRGKIVSIQVENSHAVEYGQVLFRVDPSG